jgi:hypothetical protein
MNRFLAICDLQETAIAPIAEIIKKALTQSKLSEISENKSALSVDPRTPFKEFA